MRIENLEGDESMIATWVKMRSAYEKNPLEPHYRTEDVNSRSEADTVFNAGGLFDVVIPEWTGWFNDPSAFPGDESSTTSI